MKTAKIIYTTKKPLYVEQYLNLKENHFPQVVQQLIKSNLISLDDNVVFSINDKESLNNDEHDYFIYDIEIN